MESEKLKKCSRCGKEMRAHAVRNCPHDAVNTKYGKRICYHCCSQCKFSRIEGDGQICSYLKKGE
ncbi:MAG: hypothetical protein DBY45_10180 [Clostridiales bacterium]|nr:MAG: hypothetical protein DBY45_10180 [Clostridiales bacterium]